MYSKVKKLQFTDFTLGQLVSSGVHIGHRSIATDPRIFEMLAGDRNGISILRLERSLAGLKPGLSVLAKVVAKRGKALFPNVDPRIFGAISTRIKKFCLRYFLVDRKVPGLLTNFMVIRRSFSDLQKTKIAPSFTFGFTSNDHHILWESNLVNLPSIGVFDSNTNPMGHAFYPVPGNDDSFSALHLYYQLAFRALGDGLNRYLFKWGATKKFKVKRLVNRFYNLTLIRPKSVSNRILSNYEDLKIDFIPESINIKKKKNFRLFILGTLSALTQIFYINVLSYLVNQTYYGYSSIPGGAYSKYPFLNIGLDFFSHGNLFPYRKLVRLPESTRMYLGYKQFFKFIGSYDYNLFDQMPSDKNNIRFKMLGFAKARSIVVSTIKKRLRTVILKNSIAKVETMFANSEKKASVLAETDFHTSNLINVQTRIYKNRRHFPASNCLKAPYRRKIKYVSYYSTAKNLYKLPGFRTLKLKRSKNKKFQKQAQNLRNEVATSISGFNENLFSYTKKFRTNRLAGKLTQIVFQKRTAHYSKNYPGNFNKQTNHKNLPNNSPKKERGYTLQDLFNPQEWKEFLHGLSNNSAKNVSENSNAPVLNKPEFKPMPSSVSKPFVFTQSAANTNNNNNNNRPNFFKYPRRGQYQDEKFGHSNNSDRYNQYNTRKSKYSNFNKPFSHDSNYHYNNKPYHKPHNHFRNDVKFNSNNKDTDNKFPLPNNYNQFNSKNKHYKNFYSHKYYNHKHNFNPNTASHVNTVDNRNLSRPNNFNARPDQSQGVPFQPSHSGKFKQNFKPYFGYKNRYNPRWQNNHYFQKYQPNTEPGKFDQKFPNRIDYSRRPNYNNWKHKTFHKQENKPFNPYWNANSNRKNYFKPKFQKFNKIIKYEPPPERGFNPFKQLRKRLLALYFVTRKLRKSKLKNFGRLARQKITNPNYFIAHHIPFIQRIYKKFNFIPGRFKFRRRKKFKLRSQFRKPKVQISPATIRVVLKRWTKKIFRKLKRKKQYKHKIKFKFVWLLVQKLFKKKPAAFKRFLVRKLRRYQIYRKPILQRYKSFDVRRLLIRLPKFRRSIVRKNIYKFPFRYKNYFYRLNSYFRFYLRDLQSVFTDVKNGVLAFKIAEQFKLQFDEESKNFLSTSLQLPFQNQQRLLSYFDFKIRDMNNLVVPRKIKRRGHSRKFLPSMDFYSAFRSRLLLRLRNFCYKNSKLSRFYIKNFIRPAFNTVGYKVFDYGLLLRSIHNRRLSKQQFIKLKREERLEKINRKFFNSMSLFKDWQKEKWKKSFAEWKKKNAKELIRDRQSIVLRALKFNMKVPAIILDKKTAIFKKRLPRSILKLSRKKNLREVVPIRRWVNKPIAHLSKLRFGSISR